MLRLVTFGGLMLSGEAGIEPVTQRRRLALLAVLAVAGERGASRDKLMSCLWPESPTPTARHALEQLLYELRRHLGNELLLGADPLRLNPDVITTDVGSFDQALAQGALAEAVEVYRGPFLDGFFLGEAPEFERWCETERARLAQAHSQTVYRLAREEGERGHHTAAITLWRKLSAAEPLDGRAALGLMRALVAAGDRAGALQSARVYEALVRDELQTDPDPTVTAFLRELRTHEQHDVPPPPPQRGQPPPTSQSDLDDLRSALSDRYAVNAVVSQGGMATVYRARDHRHERTVAIKVMRPEIAHVVSAERFLREIQIAGRLQHPLIVPVLDSGTIGPGPVPTLWYAMPYVDGETLRDRLNRENQLPIEDAVGIACEVADALAGAHAQGVVHRDIKPENVLLSGGHALITDFGIARALTTASSDRLTATGVAMGTVAYMSPEQATSDSPPDPRSDLYALGCVLYEMVAGQPPFVASTTQGVLARHAADPVPSVRTVRPAVPQGLEVVIERALAKVPADRFATATDFAAALRRGARSPVARPRRVPAAVLGAGAVMVLVAAMAVGLRRRGTPALNPRRVVVAAFANRTADSSLALLGRQAAEWISRGVQLTGLLEVADPAGVPPQGAGAAADGTRSLAIATGSGLVVWGTVDSRGDHIELSAHITDARRGEFLLDLDPVPTDRADPRPALITLRQRLMAGLAQAVDERFNDPGWVAGQPPRYEAYVAFATGLDIGYNRVDLPDAIRYYYRAAALDSSYALPLIHAALAFYYLGACDSTEALDRRLRRMALTRSEEWQVDRELAWCHGDLQGAYQLSRRLVDAMPGSAVMSSALSRDALAVDRPGEALAQSERFDSIPPSLRERRAYYGNVATAYHWVGDHGRELEAARRMVQNGATTLHQLEGQRIELMALAALGRVREVNERLDAVASASTPASALATDPPSQRYPGTVMRETALELATHGHEREGRAVLDREMAWLASRPAEEQTNDYVRFEWAQTLYAAGFGDSARRVAEPLARAHPRNANYLGLIGVLAAQRGDRSQAEQTDSALRALEEPLSTAAFWRAGIAARLGDRARAVAFLSRARSEGWWLFQNALNRRYWNILGPHVEPSFEALRGYGPFEALVRPKG